MNEAKPKKSDFILRIVKEPSLPAWGAVIVSLFALFKVQEVIEVKPQIVNVIKNVTEVKKEIANLHEVLVQEDKASKSENFSILDLDKKVKKITPPESQGPYAAAIVVIELMRIPLRNFMVVSSQNLIFPNSTIVIYHNILEIHFLKSIPRVLEEVTDFLNVQYIPDLESKEELYSVNGMSYVFGKDDITFDFPIKKKT